MARSFRAVAPEFVHHVLAPRARSRPSGSSSASTNPADGESIVVSLIRSSRSIPLIIVTILPGMLPVLLVDPPGRNPARAGHQPRSS
jgi:hypothetical protein